MRSIGHPRQPRVPQPGCGRGAGKFEEAVLYRLASALVADAERRLRDLDPVAVRGCSNSSCDFAVAGRGRAAQRKAAGAGRVLCAGTPLLVLSPGQHGTPVPIARRCGSAVGSDRFGSGSHWKGSRTCLRNDGVKTTRKYRRLRAGPVPRARCPLAATVIASWRSRRETSVVSPRSSRATRTGS